MKSTKLTLLLVAALLLSACGRKLEGTYSDQVGMTSYVFKPNGKVTVTISSILGTGETETMNYEFDGKNIKLFDPENRGDNLVMTLLGDGAIQGPMGMKLTKRTGSRVVQPETRGISYGSSPADSSVAMPTQPAVRQGTVQTFRRDSNGQLINLGPKPSSRGQEPAPSDNVAVQRIVLNNLRQLSAAADQFYLENGVSTASYDQLVGSDKYIKEVRPADGEDYRTLDFKQGQELRVTTRTDLTIRYAP